jgi:crotonobetainyl-CoA:carnitine CoA-transferase CaiB-like acyl-CoA transferase
VAPARPEAGEHTEQVLREAGFSVAEIAHLLSQKVVSKL